jgi:PAS domain S-box-containing protein
VDNLPELAWAARPDGHIDFYNRRWYAYTGTTPEQMEGWGWGQVHDPAVLPDVVARWRRSIETGEPFEMEFPLRGADGAFRWFLTRVSPLRDADGQIARWVGTNTDIHDRKGAEAALRESEERLRVALKHAPIVVQRLDRELRYEWMYNPHPDTPQRLIGQRAGATRPPEEAEPYVRLLQGVLDTGEGARVELQFQMPSGLVVADVTVEPVRNEAGEVVGVLTSSYDVTEIRRAEAALRESEARFRAVYEQAAVGVTVVEPETGRLLRVNARYCEIAGRPAEDRVGRSLFELVHPADRAADRALFAAMARGETAELRREKRYVLPDGTVRWVDVSARRLTASPDGPALAVNVVQDVTARKLAEEALAEAAAELEVANVELEEANAELEARVATRTMELEATIGRLRESEGRWRQLVERNPDPVLITVEGRIAYANRAAVLLGAHVGLADLVGRHVLEFIPDATRDQSRERLGVLQAGGAIPPVEHAFVGTDGAVRYVESYAVPVTFEGRAASLSVGRDLTARKEAEAAVRESEARFRLLVESVRDYAIFLLDPEGHVVSWNPGAERAKGYAAAEIIGRHFSVFYSEDAVAAGLPEQELRTAEREGRAEDEGWRVRKDGSRFWASVVVTALRGEDGALRGFAKITRDITERQAAEDALRTSEERFRSLFRSTPIGVAVGDLQGTLLDANPALHDLLGYAPGALRGKTIRELTHPADRKLSATLYAELLAGRRPVFQVEKRYLREDGAVVWAQTTVTAVRDEEGQPVYTVGSVADVTERRQLEQAAVEAAEAERRRLSYELHDDLAQRLAGASVLSHTLAEQLGAEAHEGARTAVRVGDLVRDAMAHARALSRALAPVDLLAEGLAEALGRLCMSTEAAYGVRCHVEAVGSVADPAVATHLFRVAQEAVSNAARHAGAQAVTVSLGVVGDRLRLAIRDDGRGMPAGALGDGGTLGLRTMRARAAALGGTLTVESAPGRGTTVTCTVPRPSKRRSA